MEAIRKIVDGSLLDNIISLPQHFQNKKVEIIVLPVEEPVKSLKITAAELDSILVGSITESLMGILPNEGKTLADYREERLQKYEYTD
jgi:TctA family transporter